MIAPIPSNRTERTTTGRGMLAAPRAAPADSDLPAEQQQAIAAQHQAFDYEAAERAEIEREHEVLSALLMAFLKNEDEITKKWIALI